VTPQTSQNMRANANALNEVSGTPANHFLPNLAATPGSLATNLSSHTPHLGEPTTGGCSAPLSMQGALRETLTPPAASFQSFTPMNTIDLLANMLLSPASAVLSDRLRGPLGEAVAGALASIAPAISPQQGPTKTSPAVTPAAEASFSFPVISGLASPIEQPAAPALSPLQCVELLSNMLASSTELPQELWQPLDEVLVDARASLMAALSSTPVGTHHTPNNTPVSVAANIPEPSPPRFSAVKVAAVSPVLGDLGGKSPVVVKSAVVSEDISTAPLALVATTPESTLAAIPAHAAGAVLTPAATLPDAELVQARRSLSNSPMAGQTVFTAPDATTPQAWQMRTDAGTTPFRRSRVAQVAQLQSPSAGARLFAAANSASPAAMEMVQLVAGGSPFAAATTPTVAIAPPVAAATSPLPVATLSLMAVTSLPQATIPSPGAAEASPAPAAASPPPVLTLEMAVPSQHADTTSLFMDAPALSTSRGTMDQAVASSLQRAACNKGHCSTVAMLLTQEVAVDPPTGTSAPPPSSSAVQAAVCFATISEPANRIAENLQLPVDTSPTQALINTTAPSLAHSGPVPPAIATPTQAAGMETHSTPGGSAAASSLSALHSAICGSSQPHCAANAGTPRPATLPLRFPTESTLPAPQHVTVDLQVHSSGVKVHLLPECPAESQPPAAQTTPTHSPPSLSMPPVGSEMRRRSNSAKPALSHAVSASGGTPLVEEAVDGENAVLVGIQAAVDKATENSVEHVGSPKAQSPVSVQPHVGSAGNSPAPQNSNVQPPALHTTHTCAAHSTTGVAHSRQVKAASDGHSSRARSGWAAAPHAFANTTTGDRASTALAAHSEECVSEQQRSHGQTKAGKSSAQQRRATRATVDEEEKRESSQDSDAKAPLKSRAVATATSAEASGAAEGASSRATKRTTRATRATFADPSAATVDEALPMKAARGRQASLRATRAAAFDTTIAAEEATPKRAKRSASADTSTVADAAPVDAAATQVPAKAAQSKRLNRATLAQSAAAEDSKPKRATSRATSVSTGAGKEAPATEQPKRRRRASVSLQPAGSEDGPVESVRMTTRSGRTRSVSTSADSMQSKPKGGQKGSRKTTSKRGRVSLENIDPMLADMATSKFTSALSPVLEDEPAVSKAERAFSWPGTCAFQRIVCPCMLPSPQCRLVSISKFGVDAVMFCSQSEAEAWSCS
jgi:hypothetical protein